MAIKPISYLKKYHSIYLKKLYEKVSIVKKICKLDNRTNILSQQPKSYV